MDETADSVNNKRDNGETERGTMKDLNIALQILVCIGVAYIFVKGCLCCLYDVSCWALKLLDADEKS